MFSIDFSVNGNGVSIFRLVCMRLGDGTRTVLFSGSGGDSIHLHACVTLIADEAFILVLFIYFKEMHRFDSQYQIYYWL